MENFQVPVIVEWSNRRVLLSTQLAEVYGCEVSNIKKNFNANKNHYIEGVHYFKITGFDLQNLRMRYPQLLISPKTRTLYLWTAAGIFFHCKMINTPQVWELFSQIGARLSSENHPVLDEIIFDKIKPLEPKPDEAYVYALELDNNLVKIGMSNDVDSRKGSIRRKLQLETLRTYHADFIQRQKAHQVEKSCHRFFHDRLAYRQEYFRISFDEARKIIYYFMSFTKSPSVNDHVRAEELLQIADTMGNTPERKNILIEAANIIAGKKVA